MDEIKDIDIKKDFEAIGADYKKLISGINDIKQDMVKELLLDAAATFFPCMCLFIVIYVHLTVGVNIMSEDLLQKSNIAIFIAMFIPLVRFFSKVIQFRDRLNLAIMQYTLLEYIHAGIDKANEYEGNPINTEKEGEK